MPAAQRVARFFRLASAAFAGLYGILLPLAVLMLLAGYLALLYVAVFREIDPITSQRIVAVEPENRHLNREVVRQITITREICSRRAQQIDLLLAWTEARPVGEDRPIVAFTTVLRDLQQGCQMTVITQSVPQSLPPGRYVYAVSARSCSALNECKNRDLDTIPFTIAGGQWHGMDILPQR